MHSPSLRSLRQENFCDFEGSQSYNKTWLLENKNELTKNYDVLSFNKLIFNFF